VFTFGKEGSSGGQFFDSHLGKVKLNEEAVDFSALDVGYLAGDKYDKYMAGVLAGARARVGSVDELGAPAYKGVSGDFILTYANERDRDGKLSRLGLMTDHKVCVVCSVVGCSPFSSSLAYVYLILYARSQIEWHSPSQL
jgi:hypothetical protein